MGRWTQFLIRFCDRFVGVDLAKKCVAARQRRFLDFQKAALLRMMEQLMTAWWIEAWILYFLLIL